MRAFEITFYHPAKATRDAISDGASPRLIQGGITDKRVFLAETIGEVVGAAEEWISNQSAYVQNIRDLGLAHTCERVEQVA